MGKRDLTINVVCDTPTCEWEEKTIRKIVCKTYTEYENLFDNWILEMKDPEDVCKYCGEFGDCRSTN